MNLFYKKPHRALIILIGCLLLSQLATGQVNPHDDHVFASREIADIRITMSAQDKQNLLAEENINSNTYYLADLIFENSKLNESVSSVGIRLRGNTSRGHPKRSFKIDFREFGGKKFRDYKKFNLKAENNDPSVIREHLALELFRLQGVPAARSHHARVYINEEYMGLYLNVEQIDDEFVQERFNNDEGNLYKCYWGSTLQNDGQIFDQQRYELKTNEELNDRSILENMVQILNDNTSANWTSRFEQVFNVSRFIKYLAAEALLGHWDGYSYNKNNFYLYEDPETGLIEFIAYDADNTFGIDWVDRDWSNRDLLDWTKHGDPRPLATNILAIEEYQEKYVVELTRLLNGYFSEDYLYPVFDEYRELLASANETDPYYPLTFGFDHQTYLDSHNQNQLANHLPYGLKPYVQLRSTEARTQIPEVIITSMEIMKDLSVYPNPVTNHVIHVSGSQVQSTTARFLDVKGRSFSVRPEKSLKNNITNYRLPDSMSSGIYFLQINGQTLKLQVR